MLDRILLPVDGTEMYSETLTYIRELGNVSETEILLLHVQEKDSGDAANHPLLKGYCDALGSDNWKFTAVLRNGNATEEIVRYAAQENPTMIVMSTHGRSGLENIRKGSVTEQVVRQSPCPVFILHSTRADSDAAGKQNLFKRMLVPLDGSDVSAAILPCVERFAKRFGSEVILFHDHPDCDEDADPGKRREFMDRHGVDLANAGVPVHLDCSTHLRPVNEILKRIDELNIDIVAMATHGQGGERRALDESVTANVMRHSSRPLLVWSSDPQCPPAS